MKNVVIGDLILGEGIPKICVPIVGKTRSQIRQAAERLVDGVYDLVEWRMDWFDEVDDLKAVCRMAEEIKEKIHGPLLVTFRSQKEGGERELSFTDYAKRNIALARSGAVDLVDVELDSGEKERDMLVQSLKSLGVRVILSHHDFEKTPDFDTMWERLVRMDALGADVVKIAVMPKEKEDVLRLMQVTVRARKELSCPVISMSMGKEGIISRLTGEVFGSCLTFGTIGTSSAPGQIDTIQLKEWLDRFHKIQTL